MKNYMVLIGLFAALASFVATSVRGADGFARWESEIAALEKRDAEQLGAAGGKADTVFVGSSSIRLWDLEKSFPDKAYVNHGFGGSTVADSAHFLDRLVLKLQPNTIVLYAGDNDIANGMKPAEVFHDFQSFVAGVHKALPQARILYIATKPSPARSKFFPTQKETNQLIADFMRQDSERLFFIDVVKPMLDSEGQPRSELFVSDMLHLNAKGYEVWTELLQPLLK